MRRLRLDYLMELRRFKKEAPAEFRRIKAMPVRARVGRVNKPNSGATIAFIRNRRRDAFTLIPPSGDLQDLTFVECARELHAKPSEKPHPLPASHHAQVRQAIERFTQALHAEQTAVRSMTHKHTPAEQSAIALLKQLSDYHLVGAEEQHLCRLAIDAIGKVRFQKLAPRIAAIASRQKKKPDPVHLLIDKVVAALRPYPLLEPSNPDMPDAPPAGFAPDIILSESFA